MVVKLRHPLIPDCPVAFSSKLNSVVYACPVSSPHSPHACPCSAHTGLSGPTATRHPPPCLLPLPHLPILAHSCRPWFAPNVIAEAWRRGIPPLPSAFPFTSCIIPSMSPPFFPPPLVHCPLSSFGLPSLSHFLAFLHLTLPHTLLTVCFVHHLLPQWPLCTVTPHTGVG